ncbi:UNVERIFIED_CONTAM: cell division protein FtsL [Jeotgalibacillus campisalis]
MDFLGFWMALGASAIAVIAAWFARRQAVAAERSNVYAKEQADAAKSANLYAKEQAEAAKEANRLARESAAIAFSASAFRWEVVADGGGKFLVFNAGTATAYKVRMTTPDFMIGSEIMAVKMEPLERHIIEAVLHPDHASIPLLRPVLNITWEDRTGEAPLERRFSTSLPDNP